jgi:hypothetical protein
LAASFYKAPFKKLGGAIRSFGQWIGKKIEPIAHPKRHYARKIEAHNRLFLVKQGFTEIDNGDLSYIDSAGNPLRLVQTNTAQITFIVIGKRRSRAYLKLDKKGRYTEYTGPTTI